MPTHLYFRTRARTYTYVSFSFPKCFFRFERFFVQLPIDFVWKWQIFENDREYFHVKG